MRKIFEPRNYSRVPEPVLHVSRNHRLAVRQKRAPNGITRIVDGIEVLALHDPKIWIIEIDCSIDVQGY